MDFRVELSEQAQGDIAAIYDWLESQLAGDAGTRWFVALGAAIESLNSFPFRCPLAPENPDSPVEVRQLLYGHNRIYTESCFRFREALCTCSISVTAAAGRFAPVSEQSVNNSLPSTG